MMIDMYSSIIKLDHPFNKNKYFTWGDECRKGEMMNLYF